MIINFMKILKINGLREVEDKFQILTENEIDNLPSDKAIWILGNTKFQSLVNNF